jgi:hypothetical protein
MNEKIKGHQLERGADVYVRQSTPYQVRNHLERKEKQYALAQRAFQLGIVIDEDLGCSGGWHSGAARLRPTAGICVPGPGESGISSGGFASGAQQP